MREKSSTGPRVSVSMLKTEEGMENVTYSRELADDTLWDRVQVTVKGLGTSRNNTETVSVLTGQRKGGSLDTLSSQG